MGLYLLNLGYGFEGSFQQLGQFEFISHALGGKDAHSPGNRFRKTWLAAVPIPLPANYLRGIDVQRYDFEVGKWSYLRGEHKLGGWWYYYLYALAIKTPLGTLILIGFAGFIMIVRREYTVNFRDEMVLLIPAILVLAFVSSQTGFNRYLRYVLPAVPFLFIFASRVAKAFPMKHRLSMILCGTCIACSVVGSLSIFPHSMSFFNLAAGGPIGGPRHLLDANIDWGQDLLELKRFVVRHPEVSPIQLAYFGFVDPAIAGFPFERFSPSDMVPGWYAISANHVFGCRQYETDAPTLMQFQRLAPDVMIGYSIYLYHIDAEKIEFLKTSGP